MNGMANLPKIASLARSKVEKIKVVTVFDAVFPESKDRLQPAIP